jgi:hypothetical protein
MMKTLLLLGLAGLVCGCTPHEVRCDGRLEPINVSTPAPPAAPAPGAGSLPGVP